MSHPSLSPAEAERLEMLAEEAGEIVQAVTKVLRHGYKSYHPDSEAPTTNRTDLQNELADLMAVTAFMIYCEDLPPLPRVSKKIVQKFGESPPVWTHHQTEAYRRWRSDLSAAVKYERANGDDEAEN